FKKYRIEQRGVQINLLVEDNPQLDYFVKKDFPILEEKFRTFGFGALTIRPVVDEALTQENREEHERKVSNMLAAESASQYQISELKKIRSDETAAKAEKIPEKIDTALAEGVSFGRKINGSSPVTSMSFIAGEGSGVIFEGYVFEAHHREFPSHSTGKTNHVLEMKLADETAVFQVIKWGRKENEISQFDKIVDKVKAANMGEEGTIQFEQGIWLRVRGNIAHDVYKDDLVMTVSDAVEISKKEDCSKIASQINAVKSDKIQIGREIKNSEPITPMRSVSEFST
ncbi:MAG TPA: PolC-type DNA polymerase III, partial [Lactococcus sp.]|nr:PolC-type DNA polymerase III [Lactococcus sp.]